MTEHLQSGQHLDAERLGAFAEGATTEREREEMLAHVAECAECRELVFLMQETEAAAETSAPVGRSDGAWRRKLMPFALAGAALACGLTAIVFLRSHRAAPENQARVATVEAPRADNDSSSVLQRESASDNKRQKTTLPRKVAPESRAAGTLEGSRKAAGATHGAMAGAIEGPIPRSDAQLNALGRPASPAPTLAPSAQAAPPAAAPGSVAGIVQQVTAAPTIPPVPGEPMVNHAESAAQKAAAAAHAPPAAAIPGPSDTRAISQLNARNSGLTLRIQPERGPKDGFSEVSGLVTDASGAVVTGATVSLRNPEVATAREVKTGIDGRFAIADLPAGHYELSVAAPGFERSLEQIDLKPRDLALLDSVLQVGAASETVAVSAAPEVLETSQAEVGAHIAGAAVKLPGLTPALGMVTAGKRMLSVDAAGTLFLSTNAGKSWKKVKPHWQGKVTQIALSPVAYSGGNSGASAASGASAMFELTTESGAVWLSTDGMHWRQR